jgi:hypothetical protein
MEFIESVETWDSGGHVMLDLVHLKNGKVLAIGDESVGLYANVEQTISGPDLGSIVFDRPAGPGETFSHTMRMSLWDALSLNASGKESLYYLLVDMAVDEAKEVLARERAFSDDELRELEFESDWDLRPNPEAKVGDVGTIDNQELMITVSCDVRKEAPSPTETKWNDETANFNLRSDEGGRALAWTSTTPALFYVYDPAEAGYTIELTTKEQAEQGIEQLRSEGWFDWPPKKDDPVCAHCELPYSRHPHDGCVGFDEVTTEFDA